MRHGSVTGYRHHGCRCDECREAHRVLVVKNRADRLAAGRLSHGTRSAYDAGCRCADCTRARRNIYLAGIDEAPK